jgi:hypothetical protein
MSEKVVTAADLADVEASPIERGDQGRSRLGRGITPRR